MNKSKNQENKRLASILYEKKLNFLYQKGLIGNDTIREKKLSFKNLLNIQNQDVLIVYPLCQQACHSVQSEYLTLY